MCKINLGLSILSRREDNYHNIQSVMYPVQGLSDVVEILKTEEPGCQYTSSGIAVNCSDSKNLCVKAYELMRSRFDIGGVKIHLHKKVPFGAGLGGGSADAAAVLNILNELFELQLNNEQLCSMAAMLGCDVPFFVDSQPAVVSERGDVLTPIDFSLKGVNIVIVKPEVGISTAEAYAGVTPRIPKYLPSEVVAMECGTWRELLVNDFEQSLFPKYSELAHIKQSLYDSGAFYASMSGSGSAIFGLFFDEVKIAPELHKHFVYQGVLG